MGTHRAGVEVSSPVFKTLIEHIKSAELETTGKVFLEGFYCHAGHSYSVTNTQAALELLSEEIEAGMAALRLAKSEFGASTTSTRNWTISIGATPTAMTAAAMAVDSEIKRVFAEKTGDLGRDRCRVEIHAGVYTMLDLQQLSTHVMPPPYELTVKDIAISILAEVVSVYSGRGVDGRDEALVAVGTVGLGREPGKEWSGWGAVSNWYMASSKGIVEESGWIVGRISQEHGILTEKEKGKGEKLTVGQKVKIWPQHACIAGSGHGWYFVVDKKDIVQDVWVRWRGW